MRIKNIEQVEDFLKAVRKCKDKVWLESPAGDTYNLKSGFSKYLAMGALLQNDGDSLELFCSSTEDEINFFEFFREHADTL